MLCSPWRQAVDCEITLSTKRSTRKLAQFSAQFQMHRMFVLQTMIYNIIKTAPNQSET